MKPIPTVLTSALILLFLIVTVNSQKSTGNPDPGKSYYTKIDSLFNTGKYFEARDLFINHQKNLSEADRLKAGIYLDYYFNRPEASISKMELLFEKYESEVSDTLKYELLSVGHVNYSRLYDYREAKETIDLLLSDYPELIPEKEKEDLQNTQIIWSELTDQPRQEVVIDNSADLEIIRDKANLQNLKVTAGNAEHIFVFDTGANISTITESAAEEFSLNIFNKTFDVQGITGATVQSRVAVAPELEIGNVLIKNAVFLVFPDEALAFPQIDYQIHGVLGFPVIEAMGEIQITRDNRFIIPDEPTMFDKQNLAIDFLTPLIHLKDKRGRGTYTFDTGASNTMLYNTYYEQNEEEVTANHSPAEISFGGAGGQVSQPGFYISFEPKINGEHVRMDSVFVLKEELNPENLYLGNIGQDLISQYEKMTINFDDMFIRFD